MHKVDKFIDIIHNISREKSNIDTDHEIILKYIEKINTFIINATKYGYVSLIIKFTLDKVYDYPDEYIPSSNNYFYQLNTLDSKRYIKDYLIDHYIGEDFNVYEENDDLVIKWNLCHE